LASDLRIPLGDLPPGFTLDQVVSAHAPFREKRSLLYPRIRAILDKVAFPVPEPLRKLARIRSFRLFVSTTFDSVLVKTLNEERYQGRPETPALSFSPSHSDDLNERHLREGASVVFHLFGRASASPDYAVTEADRLEFMHSLQSRESRPNRLLDELHQRHLLLLGNGFPDWFTRFFIRTVKCDRLWTLREKIEIVADEQVQQDQRLAVFLTQFSRETTLFTEGNPVDFVNLLYQKWSERQSAGLAPGSPVPVASAAVEEDLELMEPGSVFISYASEDLLAAQRLRDALRQAGLDVWFDQTRLGAGEAYEEKIRFHIRKCILFLPLISEHTEVVEPRFYRKEWHWANLRLPEFTGTQRPFILPVLIDETPFETALVPAEFRTLQNTKAHGGVPPDEFVTQVRTIIREVRKRERVSA
jgi:hypothetical protein